MNRKFFYTALGFTLLILLTHSLFNTFLFKFINIETYYLRNLKDILAISVIIYESISAKKSIQKITLSLMTVSIFAYFMKIMSWPFSSLLFYGSLLANCVVLFVNAVRSNTPILKTLLLIYPITRVLITDRYFHTSTAWWTLEIFIPAAFAIFLLFARKKI